MKTTASQFLDVWMTCVCWVGNTQRSPAAAPIFRAAAMGELQGRHGVVVAAEGAAYFDKLRADAWGARNGLTP
jgi:hypothetical protein